MNRRSVFKHLAMASAAAWVLPSCITDTKKVSIALNHLQITGEEEALLGDIADVIIPVTDTPGARAVQAHLFTLIMVDDCLGREEQEKYLKGMRAFNEGVKSANGTSFTDASSQERLQMLIGLEERGKALDAETKFFYSKTRAYILQGYLSSQHFLTDVRPYKLVPGPRFNGCAPVSKGSTTIS